MAPSPVPLLRDRTTPLEAAHNGGKYAGGTAHISGVPCDGYHERIGADMARPAVLLRRRSVRAFGCAEVERRSTDVGVPVKPMAKHLFLFSCDDKSVHRHGDGAALGAELP
jgi:hypothetical protein